MQIGDFEKTLKVEKTEKAGARASFINENKRKIRSASVVFLKVSCAPSATHLRVSRKISSLMRGH